MSKHNHRTGSLQHPSSSFNRYVLSTFLKVRPQFLGVLEIVLGIAVFALTIWKGLFYILWASIISLFIGSLTVLAAHKQTILWIRVSQALNYLNAITSIVSIPIHALANDGVTNIVLMVCDALIFIFSIIVASTSCSRPKRRRVQRHYSSGVYYMNSPVTVNNIIHMTQPNSSATPINFNSVQYGLPSEYGPGFSRRPEY